MKAILAINGILQPKDELGQEKIHLRRRSVAKRFGHGEFDLLICLLFLPEAVASDGRDDIAELTECDYLLVAELVRESILLLAHGLGIE